MKAQLIETYRGHDIKKCSWGYCVGLQHFTKLQGARNYIELLERQQLGKESSDDVK